MELTYRTDGDYQVPNLTAPEEQPQILGKYALLRKKYLKENRRVLFVNLLTAGTLNEHLAEIDQAANERLELITRQAAKAQGVTEELKAQDRMKWVGMMNSIRHSAEETILNDLIHA